jgi:hypothetical protein
MAKRSISGAEIKSYLDDALRRNETCKGVTVARVYEGEMKSANWDAECEHQLGEPVSPDCQRAFIVLKQVLQQQYDLLIQD